MRLETGRLLWQGYVFPRPHCLRHTPSPWLGCIIDIEPRGKSEDDCSYYKIILFKGFFKGALIFKVLAHYLLHERARV